MRPGIEILQVAAAGTAVGSQLRRICSDVERLEVALSELPDSPDTLQLSTLIEFLGYQAMSLAAGEDLDALEKMIGEFRRRLEGDTDAEARPSWMTVRELSRLGRSDDRIGGTAFVLPRADRSDSAPTATNL